MVTISAFADEIAPDLDLQMDVLESLDIHCIDVRSIDDLNVSRFSAAQARNYAGRLAGRGFSVPCIGSPVGKIRLDEDFAAHLDVLKRCIDVAQAMNSPCIRVFSFYPAPGRKIEDCRSQVFGQMQAMIEVAAAGRVVLLHENEKAIYGRNPSAVKDLLTTLGGEHFKGIFDPANFVEEGFAPYDQGWKAGLDKLTCRFHVKDVRRGQTPCVPAGEGDGQFEELFADLAAANFSGAMTLEPHMKVAGKAGGFSGAQLFEQAAVSLRRLCRQHGLAVGR